MNQYSSDKLVQVSKMIPWGCFVCPSTCTALVNEQIARVVPLASHGTTSGHKNKATDSHWDQEIVVVVSCVRQMSKVILHLVYFHANLIMSDCFHQKRHLGEPAGFCYTGKVSEGKNKLRSRLSTENTWGWMYRSPLLPRSRNSMFVTFWKKSSLSILVRLLYEKNQKSDTVWEFGHKLQVPIVSRTVRFVTGALTLCLETVVPPSCWQGQPGVAGNVRCFLVLVFSVVQGTVDTHRQGHQKGEPRKRYRIHWLCDRSLDWNCLTHKQK